MPLTQSQIIEKLASVDESLTKKQIKALLGSIAELAYANAKDGFTIPGLGKLVVVNRAARTGRNPKTGEPMKIPAKTVLKFRVAKAAKDAILVGGKKAPAKKAAPAAKPAAKKAAPAPKAVAKKAPAKKK